MKKYKLELSGKDSRPDSDYNSTQLRNGIVIEMEHTDNIEIAKIIAKDHLDEFPDYYIELAKMEEKLRGEMEDPSPDDMEKLID